MVSNLTPANWNNEPGADALRRAYELLKTNPKKAVNELEALADRGSLMSIWYLADAYYSGRYFAKDMNGAKKWYRRAEESGASYGSHMLGSVCYKIEEFPEALSAFSRGAANGYAPSIYRLGMMYKDGKGTSVDLNESRRLLESAVAKGHLFAKRDLGTLYISGKMGIQAIPKGFLMIVSLFFDMIVITFRERNTISEFDERVIS